MRVTADAQAQLQHAYALYDLGCALRRSNRRVESRGPLRAAQRGLSALTAAEQQVVDLAARGYTNRQIAQHLTLSRRTVETHLAHAYRKLDIRSRNELTGILSTA